MKEIFVLSLSFGNYLKADGGVDKAIKDYQELFNQNEISYVHVSPVLPAGILGKVLNANHSFLYTLIIDGVYKGIMDEEEINAEILKISKTSSICSIHIHHTKKFREDFFGDLLEAIKAPVYFFVHDYYSICSQPNLLRNDKVFCGEGEKNRNICKGCIYSNTLDKHRHTIVQILNSGLPVYVVAPSEIAIRIWKNTYGNDFNGVEYLLIPHQQAEGKYKIFPDVSGDIKIAFVGRFDTNKGKESWIKLCEAITENKLPYSLFYFGFSEINALNVTKVNVRVTPENPNMMLDELRNRRINAVFLWSICPETYSYAYYEAFAANCFVLTNKDSGNISYMTELNNNGKVFCNIDELICYLKRINDFSETLHNYYNSRNYGPYSYSQNKAILTLRGDDVDHYYVGQMTKKYKVAKLVKILANRLYKNKYCS